MNPLIPLLAAWWLVAERKKRTEAAEPSPMPYAPSLLTEADFAPSSKNPLDLEAFINSHKTK